VFAPPASNVSAQPEWLRDAEALKLSVVTGA
jgi:hypothetical protein